MVEQVLRPLGKDVRQVIAHAGSEAVAERFEASTQDARRHGIFGSPSFVAGDGEMFWGDDRLEEAIAWAAGAHPLMSRT
jgi:2-hydroxychromene-2-carboxylate isomerase